MVEGVLKNVDARTQLAGQNRLELLMFKLNTKQLYGINVFKVKEVIQCPPLTQVPHSHHVVRGIANIRGHTIPILDLSLAIGQTKIQDMENAFIVISEYNQAIQGFLVKSVERIVNLTWREILPPPAGALGISYLTAVTHVDKEMIEIIDVERVMAEVHGVQSELSAELREAGENLSVTKDLVLIIDDSVVARKQVSRTVEQDLGLRAITCKNGLEGINTLKKWADEEDGGELQNLALIICDIEMPEMDGYTFTTEVRSNPLLEHLYIILHTSLSGVFNQSMVKKVGANAFIPKFDPDILASAVLDQIEKEQ
ncbi:MAG: chemotaxis protein CheV [Gammaproteobacteria bacterium]|nr:chemotaxis protein CheV [Gammaproteobacteria bacterium]